MKISFSSAQNNLRVHWKRPGPSEPYLLNDPPPLHFAHRMNGQRLARGPRHPLRALPEVLVCRDRRLRPHRPVKLRLILTKLVVEQGARPLVGAAVLRGLVDGRRPEFVQTREDGSGDGVS